MKFRTQSRGNWHTKGWTDGRVDKDEWRTSGRTCGRTAGRRKERTDGRVNKYEAIDRGLGQWIDGWMRSDGHLDNKRERLERTVGRADIQTDGRMS